MVQLQGGVQSGLAHTGAKTIGEFQAKSQFWVQSFAGVAEVFFIFFPHFCYVHQLYFHSTLSIA